jgi:endonuclease/exonuclease/phosphatase family metal-dependent hydrolase
VSLSAIALGILTLTDLLRVWLPSIITIFGQAASTPAPLLGGFALVWFLLAFAAPPLVRSVGARTVALGAGATLAVCRVALLGTGGGQLQLYVASVGLLAGLTWLAATAATVADPVPGTAFGLALATLVHVAFDTYDLTWRAGIVGWTLVIVLTAAFVAALWFSGDAADAAEPADGGATAWFLFGPLSLLWGMVAGSPALAGVAVSYAFADFSGTANGGSVGDVPIAVLVALAVGLFVATALARGPRRVTGPVGAVLLLAGVVVFAFLGTVVLWTAIPTTAAGLGLLYNASARWSAPNARHDGGTSASRRGWAVVGGMAVFAVAAVLYYASYDIGYPNEWVPVVVAVAIVAVACRPRASGAEAATRDIRWDTPAAVAAAVALVVANIAPVTVHDTTKPTPNDQVRVVAYNIRMGYGLDGRFDLDGLARAIAAQRPDIVLLSEVDRAWLLNGGHDTLALLSRRLDMPYRFAPAADAVWGDAVLTRMPVIEARSLPLPAEGAPTGAQALGVVVDAGGHELAVVSTHLQPPSDGGPVTQARVVARFAREFAASRSVLVGGDLNTQPDDPAFREFLAVGLADGLVARRPLPTSPSDRPVEQIDHLLVSPDIAVTDVVAPATTASDHLPVAATLTLG